MTSGNVLAACCGHGYWTSGKFDRDENNTESRELRVRVLVMIRISLGSRVMAKLRVRIRILTDASPIKMRPVRYKLICWLTLVFFPNTIQPPTAPARRECTGTLGLQRVRHRSGPVSGTVAPKLGYG